MGKIRNPVPAASSPDENGGEWLNTRNKKKQHLNCSKTSVQISPPPLKIRGGNHPLRRPILRSPLVTLMDEAQTGLRTTKKQTSIADFFSPRLQGLPSREEAEANPPPIHQAQPIREEQMSACCGEEEMYVDFDIPGPTPYGIYSSQNSQYHDFDMPAPTPSPLNPVPDSLHDHCFRSVLSLSSPFHSAKRTCSASLCKTRSCSPHSEATLGGCDDKSVEICDGKRTFGNVTSRSGSGGNVLTDHRGDSLYGSNSTKTGIHSRQERGAEWQRVSGLRAANTEITGEAKEESRLHKPSWKCESSNNSEEDVFPDSLQTPPFFKETHRTLHFSQFTEASKARPVSGKSDIKTRAKSSHTRQRVQTVSSEKTLEKNSLLGDFTESSLHFTNDDIQTVSSEKTVEKNSLLGDFTESSLHFTNDDSSQDTQQWYSRQSLRKASERKTREKDKTASSSYATVSSSYTTESPNYGGPVTDNLQTPAFFSSQGMLGDSQETDGWGEESQISGRFRVDVVPSLGDDLQTPNFLREGCREDSGSGDVF